MLVASGEVDEEEEEEEQEEEEEDVVVNGRAPALTSWPSVDTADAINNVDVSQRRSERTSRRTGSDEGERRRARAGLENDVAVCAGG